MAGAGAGALGGLYVIGTNRHESRRIDGQLRGRAGRQGDPGASRFFISLEDDLMQRYGIERLLPARFFQEPAADHPVVRREVARVQGEGFLRNIERRITLLTIDRLWSHHLGDLQALRDELYVVQLDGRDPFTEFYRAAGKAFETLFERIDADIFEIFERVEITEAGVDWEREGLLGPSSTWTYLVNDNVLTGNTFLTLSVRASFGLWAALVCWPLLLGWAAVQHWRQWRERRRSEESAKG